MKKVYIIIPIYNTEKFLCRCLDSAFGQTYKNIEVVCVNDGSTDSSLTILNEYKNKHSNMILITKKNGGLSSARNAGLDYISDKDNSYIVFLDSDDYLSVDFVDKLMKTHLRTHSDIVCSAYYHDYLNGTIKKTSRQLTNSTLNIYEGLILLFKGKLQAHAPCKLFKGSIWNNLRFDESVFFMEDQAIMFEAFLKSNTISTTDWCGYYITISPNSLCRSVMSNKKILCALSSYKKACDYDFLMFNSEQQKTIKRESTNLFSGVFLMMYVRFSKNNATETEMKEWKRYKQFVDNNHLIQKFVPRNKKEKIKRLFYLYLRPLYKPFFTFFQKIS